MPFRDRFDCLWCGTPHVTRAPSDLEGWAQLCPTCLGKAGTNEFLRARLRTALAERGRAGEDDASAKAPSATTAAAPATTKRPRARPPAGAFPDDWYLRRGPFEHGAIHDTAWNAELDVVTRWIDGLGLHGRIDEPAAGTGFFSPLLAEQGELHASDEDGDALDLARDRLVAHRLRAHIHVADPWTVTEPGRADGVLAAFLTGRVRGAGLDRALASLRERLAAGGRLALIDLRPDPQGGPPEGIPWTWHDPAALEAAMGRAGFDAIRMTMTGRFFLLATAEAR
jgi:SAM-dependent methyltransferase